MADVHDPATRSRNMAAIRSRHTKPEMLIRKGLFNAGLRYRLHPRHLPCKPDLVLPRFKAAIFVHGCFWHQHECEMFKWPETRQDFWRRKLQINRERDSACEDSLRMAGWRVLTIWECALKGKRRLPPEAVIQMTIDWLNSRAERGLIEGR